MRSLGPRPKPHSVATPTGRSPSTAAAAASRRRAPRRRPRGAGGRGRARSPGRGAGPPAGRRTRRRRARSGRAGGPSRPAGRGAPAGRSRRARGSRCPSARRSASPRRRRSRGGTPAPPRRGRAARTPRPGARTLRRRPRLPRPRRRTTRAPRRHRGSPLDERELGREVDLDREVLRRDRGDDRRELADERGLVDGVHRRAVLGCDERRHRRERRGQAHLEAGPGGKRALLAESDEVGVRGEGGVRVAERAEPQVRRVDGTVEDVRAHVEPRDDDRVHRDAGEAVDGGEPLALEEDPVEPLADLPVGDAAHVVAEVHPHRPEGLARGRQVHGAHEVGAAQGREGTGRGGGGVEHRSIVGAPHDARLSRPRQALPALRGRGRVGAVRRRARTDAVRHGVGPPARSATKPSSSRIGRPSSRAFVSLEPALAPTTT